MTDEFERHHRRDWMTDDQWRCWRYIMELFHGAHHVPHDGRHLKECGSGVVVHVDYELATYDFGWLTRLVFLAHDRSVRVALSSASPGYMRMTVHPRAEMTGSEDQPIHERHPTLDYAVHEWKERFEDKHRPLAGGAER